MELFISLPFFQKKCSKPNRTGIYYFYFLLFRFFSLYLSIIITYMHCWSRTNPFKSLISFLLPLLSVVFFFLLPSRKASCLYFNLVSSELGVCVSVQARLKHEHVKLYDSEPKWRGFSFPIYITLKV